ncbi:MAG: quinone oxidoreductase [Polyangiaceae bacterium]|nr:quinone oxidoreductase [Polyangiaceae bacterium]
MSRAIRIDETGGPEVLRLAEVDVPAPGPGQALVRHTAIGVNYIDTYHRSGLYPLPGLPHGIGVEAAGVVEAVGAGVVGLEVGARVAYAGGTPGAYAERCVVAADKLVPLPDGIGDELAAAMLLKGMTVEYLVTRCFRVEPGMTVLWHAAAGGVGLIACQWLKALGATVIGTVGSDAKAEVALAHGCDHAIVYTREDFAARVRELTLGRGVPVVYDAVGRTTFRGSLDSLARRGMLVGFGNASGKPEPFDVLELSRRGSLYLTRPTLFDYTATRGELLASATALFERVGAGLGIEISLRVPLAEAAEAHRALERRETVGSVVLVP